MIKECVYQIVKSQCTTINLSKPHGYDLFKERENALRVQASLIESPGLYTDMTGRKNLYCFNP